MALLKELRKQFSGKARSREAQAQSKASSPYATGLPDTEEQGSYSQLKDTVYTNGFENIYRLENVDLATVRPMGQASPEPTAEVYKPTATVITPEEKAPAPRKEEEQEQGQLSLDLGEDYRGWMPSFKLKEPIQVLGLSSAAQKALLEAGKTLLEDVQDLEAVDFVGLKGLGQGHIDELLKKRDQYLSGSNVKRSRSIDFAALLRSLLGTEETKACCLVLEPFGLEELFPLVPADEVELRHLSAERREERRQTALVELSSERKRRSLQKGLQSLSKAFLKPWMEKRLDLATEFELRDRLAQVSDAPKQTEKVLEFFQNAFFDSQFPLRTTLIELAPGLYCGERHSQRMYRQVLERSKSYFYASDVRYVLEELSALIEREFARHWLGFPEGFVRKVLTLSPEFTVYRGEQGKSYVCRNPWTLDPSELSDGKWISL